MKNILVAIDFSKGNDQLLLHAREQAQDNNAKIWILFAAPPNPDFVGMEIGPKYIRDNVASELREDHKRLQNMAEVIRAEGIECEALMVQGPAADVILYEADKLDIDLIVIGSHGHGSMFNLLVGSVCNAVIKKSKRPILLIPTEEE